MGIANEAGSYKRLTATANVSKVPCIVLGFLVASTSSGTITLYDDSGTGTSTPITGTITPAAGTFVPVKVATANGLYVVIANTLDVTIVYA